MAPQMKYKAKQQF